jgi:hypothetical protein
MVITFWQKKGRLRNPPLPIFKFIDYNLLVIVLNVLVNPPLKAVSATIKTTATSAMISPYSTMPWPSSRFNKDHFVHSHTDDVCMNFFIIITTFL